MYRIYLCTIFILFVSCSSPDPQNTESNSTLSTNTESNATYDLNATKNIESNITNITINSTESNTTISIDAKSTPTFPCPISISSSASISILLDALSSECSFGIIYKDSYAQELLQVTSPKLSFKSKDLLKALAILLDEQDIFYTFDIDKKLLILSFLHTKTFDINYIATTRIGSSNTDVIFSQEGSIPTTSSTSYTNHNISSSTTQPRDKALSLATNQNSLTSGKSGSKIYSIDEIDFWGEIEDEIYNIAYRPGDAYLPIFDSTKEKDIRHKAIVLNKGAGLLSITGSKYQINRVTDYIDTLGEKLHSQVLIDVNILNLSHINKSSVGVDWGEIFKLSAFRVDGSVLNNIATTTPTINNQQSTSPLINLSDSGNSYGISIFAPNISLMQIINFLKTYGDVQSISNPKVLTLNNQPAMISVGQVLRYLQTTTYQSLASSTSIQNNSQSYPSVFSGILLDVTPSIQNDEIILKINPSITKAIDSNIENSPTALSSPPNLSTKQLSALVKLKDGQKVVLGGLINKTKSDITSYVPILGQIPLLKYLFSYTNTIENTDEMLIIITPRIIR